MQALKPAQPLMGTVQAWPGHTAHSGTKGRPSCTPHSATGSPATPAASRKKSTRPAPVAGLSSAANSSTSAPVAVHDPDPAVRTVDRETLMSYEFEWIAAPEPTAADPERFAACRQRLARDQQPECPIHCRDQWGQFNIFSAFRRSGGRQS